MEIDHSEFLDIEVVDKTPFYKYKDNLIGKMNALQKQYSSFSNEISYSEKYSIWFILNYT